MARHTDGMLLLVPADPLRPRRPDEHFAAEAAAAKDAGLDVALIDHDALADPGGAEQAVARVPNAGGTAIYRGWMLRADQYAALAAALEARDVALRTSAAQYQRAHELPGWHAALSPVTPQAEWTDGDGERDFQLACERLGQGPAVLRDYVKSMKHHWHEAAYIPDVADHTRGVEGRLPVPRATRGRVHRRLRPAPLRGLRLRRGADLVGRRHVPADHRAPRHARRHAAAHRPVALHRR